MRLPTLFAALSLVSNSVFAGTPSEGVLEIETESKTIEFQIEIADEADERSRGLMFRKSLDEQSGMLFIYPTPRVASFWMKNTLISLDMLFIDTEGRIASIARKTTPLSLNPVSSGVPVLTVLEIDGGDADRLGISVGDTVKWTETPIEK